MKKFKTKILSKTLSGSTLLETIVASVIFMIVFVLAMDILTRLIVFDNEDADYLVVENDLRKCQRQICLNAITPETKTYKYDWGEINVEVSDYKENIYQVKMVAMTNKQHRQIRFRFLKANE
jgi:hypothetical protein